MMIGIFLAFLGIVISIGALLFTFLDSKYTMITQILIMVVILVNILGMILFYLLNPFSAFLEAKLKNGMIFFIQQVNGNIVMKFPSKKTVTFDIEPYGTFFGNPHARKSFYGVPAYTVHEEIAVPPEDTLTKFCMRLEEAGVSSIEKFKQNIREGNNTVRYSDLDIKAIVRFFNYVNPHYVNVRVERIAAELSREMRQQWKTILPWISMMLVGLIFAAIAYVIITGAQQPATPPTPPSSPIPGVGK